MKKNTPTTSRLRLFSLVELMVAMGMLVVMMGFLFQFVIGAQRIWSASNRNASTFTDAQLVFSLIERDLHNAIFQYAEEFPGRGIPMYLENLSGNLANFFLVSTAPAPSGTAEQNKVGYYPIIYSLVADAGPPPTPPFPSTPFILYRDVLDQEFVSDNDYRSFAYFGSTEASLPAGWRSSSSPTRKEVLCRNIKALTLSALPAPDGNGKFLNKPRAVKITLTLYEPVLGANESTAYPERGFNKIIFLK